MILGFSDPNKFVYHYTSAETAARFILKNKTLKLAQYTGTNDPKESKDWQFNIGSNEGLDLSHYDMTELSRWLSRTLKAKTKVTCFSTDSIDLTGNHMEDIFKRGFCKPRMWAQYGDKHRGVCLVFDKALLEAQFSASHTDSFKISDSVKYVNRSIIPNLFSPQDQHYTINVDCLEKWGKAEYAKSHLMQYVERLFFEKCIDWQQESEWRCVLFSNTDQDMYFDYGPALKGIVFGDATSKANALNLKRLSAGAGLYFTKLEWKNCSPWYNFTGDFN